MIKTFKHKGLAELFGKSRTGRIFDFHGLSGDRKGTYTVHVNGPWCITFEFEDGHPCRVDFEQYHDR